MHPHHNEGDEADISMISYSDVSVTILDQRYNGFELLGVIAYQTEGTGCITYSPHLPKPDRVQTHCGIVGEETKPAIVFELKAFIDALTIRLEKLQAMPARTLWDNTQVVDISVWDEIRLLESAFEDAQLLLTAQIFQYLDYCITQGKMTTYAQARAIALHLARTS